MLKSTLIIVISYIIISCSEKTSFEKEEYANGQIKYAYQLKNGVRDGEAYKYYSNGNIMQRSTWLKGEKNGITETYYKNGKIKVQANFENNYQYGWSYKFDSLGNLLGKTYYEKSIKKGPFETYYNDGTIKSKGSFANNSKESSTYFYFEDGTPERYEYQKNDSLLYLKKFNRKGKLIASLLPINVELEIDQVCINLTHSMIPVHALKTCLFIQNIGNMTVDLKLKSFSSNSNEICVNRIDFGETIEGFLCECSGHNYECMPFKYLVNESKMEHYEVVYLH